MSFRKSDKTQEILNRFPMSRRILVILIILVVVLLLRSLISSFVPHGDTAFSALSAADQNALRIADESYRTLTDNGRNLPSILIRKSDSDSDGTHLISDSRYIGINIRGIEDTNGVSQIILPDDFVLDSAYILYNAPTSVLFLSGNTGTGDHPIQYLDSESVLCVKYNSSGFAVNFTEASADFLSKHGN